jgi:hypothetical protein
MRRRIHVSKRPSSSLLGQVKRPSNQLYTCPGNDLYMIEKKDRFRFRVLTTVV